MLEDITDVKFNSKSTREPTIRCAHCGRKAGGFAAGFARGNNGEPLCHPNAGNRPDCYILVTLYGHEIPCIKRVCYEDHENPKKYTGRAKPKVPS